jgi:putative transposase
MPDYRRAFVPGGTFFFTLVTYGRARFLCDDMSRTILREAIERTRVSHPFSIEAIVLLPDHLHAIWTLPAGDADFSMRWSLIKNAFTRGWLGQGAAEGCVSRSRQRNRRRGVWQRRFWEHRVRDQDDLLNHLNYIHYNPVKHGLAACPHAWPHSSFARWVESGTYRRDWSCSCGGKRRPVITWAGMDVTATE